MGFLSKNNISSSTDGNIKDPDVLAFYYMDQMMCSTFYLQNQECMEQYNKKWIKRGKLYRQCLNYLDQYKACIVGINADKMMSRKKLSEQELYQKRQDAKQKVNENESKNNEEEQMIVRL